RRRLRRAPPPARSLRTGMNHRGTEAQRRSGRGLIQNARPVRRQNSRSWAFRKARHALLSYLLLSVPLCLCGSLSAPAATDPVVEEAVAGRARRSETGSRGVIENGVMVIRNGKIAAVGAGGKVPVGAKVIEAQVVMPGIVGAASQIGLSTETPAAPPA